MKVSTVCFVVATTYFLPKSLAFYNVALNKTATQTDDWFTWTADRAVDGNLLDPRCSHTYTDNTTWQVDLGDSYLLDHIIIYNRATWQERLQEVEVYVAYGEESKWSLKAYKPGKAGYILTLGLHVIARRVMITRKIPNDKLTLCEVLIMGRPTAQKFQRLSGVLAEGEANATMTARSALMCAYMCQMADGCEMTEYNNTSRQCSLYSSQTFTTTTVATVDSVVILFTPPTSSTQSDSQQAG